MTKLSDLYWYREEPAVGNAFLYNCRDDDLDRDASRKIERSTIVLGKNGVAVAESDVPSLRARRTLIFLGTRRCEWNGLELSCMVHASIGQRLMTTKELRHVGCIVAELSSADAVCVAANAGVPVVEDSGGRRLINLSVERHSGQAKNRRATLL